MNAADGQHWNFNGLANLVQALHTLRRPECRLGRGLKHWPEKNVICPALLRRARGLQRMAGNPNQKTRSAPRAAPLRYGIQRQGIFPQVNPRSIGSQGNIQPVIDQHPGSVRARFGNSEIDELDE